MGRPKGPKKDKFDALPEEFRDMVAGMTEEAIRAKIAQVALDQEELMKAKEGDTDLADKVEAAKLASEVYRDGTKMNRLRIQFCKRVLEDTGKAAGEFDATPH